MSDVEKRKTVWGPEIAVSSEIDADAARDDRVGEAAFERWLRDEAAATFDAMRADPSRALSAKQVFEDIRARHFAKAPARACEAANR